MATMNAMIVLLLATMAATAGVLLVGVVGFMHGGSFNARYGNRLMRARVGLQFAAIVLLGMLMLARG